MSGKRTDGYADDLLEHDFDGIQEYDNPVPGWMAALFYGTILFAGIYVVWYAFNMGPSIQTEYLVESKTLEKQWAEYYAKHPMVPPSAEELAAAVRDPAAIALGKKQFATSCAPCHGEQAGGLIGPNLTDDRWLHGGKMTEIYGTVVNGVAGKGMPPWGRALGPDKLKAVVAYIRSLQGSNPPNAKAPEGTQVTPEPI
jgi:cytochrome c oxidase cbb3-type subunit 3